MTTLDLRYYNETTQQWEASLANGADLTALETLLMQHKNNTINPHNVTKSQVGLSDVNNTSDADKPISTATQKALNGKADATALTFIYQEIVDVETALTEHLDNYNKNTCILAMGGLQVLTSEYAARLELNIARIDNNQMTTAGIEPLVRIKEDGWYLINMQSSFTFNDNGTRQISFTVNDTDDYENSCTVRGTDIINTTVHFNKRIYLRANDVIKCYAMQNSGVSLNCFNTVLSVGMVG